MTWTDGDENREQALHVPDSRSRQYRPGRLEPDCRHGPRKVYHWELGEQAMLTDVSTVRQRRHRAVGYLVGGRTFVAGSRDGHVSAWFRAPVAADESLGMVTCCPSSAAGGGDHLDQPIQPRPDVCDIRRRRGSRRQTSDVGADPPDDPS